MLSTLQVNLKHQLFMTMVERFFWISKEILIFDENVFKIFIHHWHYCTNVSSDLRLIHKSCSELRTILQFCGLNSVPLGT